MASARTRAAAVMTRRMRFASTCRQRLLRRRQDGSGGCMELQQRIEPNAPRAPGMPPLNIFRTIAVNEPLSRGFLALGGHLLRGEALPAREREKVILRNGCGLP